MQSTQEGSLSWAKAGGSGGKSELGQSWGLRSLLPRCCLPGSGLNETVPEQRMPQLCP